MFETFEKALERPPLYAKTATAFWDEAHISKQMLKAHLDPQFEGASRTMEFIDRSVAWIGEAVSPLRYPVLLDVGCGPGIYAEKFSQTGFRVTGVDFSKRSIDYAKQSALRGGMDITYLYRDYLKLDLEERFDVATLIYCDYGALSTADRRTVMRGIHRHLKPGGKFLLDVFSMAAYRAFREEKTWELRPHGGFWREDGYLALHGRYRYPDHVTLEQTAVVSAREVTTYYLWNTCFTKRRLAEEAREAGFRVCGFFGDAAGAAYCEDSDTIAVLLEK